MVARDLLRSEKKPGNISAAKGNQHLASSDRTTSQYIKNTARTSRGVEFRSLASIQAITIAELLTSENGIGLDYLVCQYPYQAPPVGAVRRDVVTSVLSPSMWYRYTRCPDLQVSGQISMWFRYTRCPDLQVSGQKK